MTRNPLASRLRPLAVMVAVLSPLLVPTSSAADFVRPPLTLSTLGQDADSPQVAIDSDGDALVVWMTDSGVIEARARSAAGTLGPLLTLSPAASYSEGPDVAMDSRGNALAAWRTRDDTLDCSGGGCFRVQARLRSATRVLGPVQTLSALGQNAANPTVAMAANGDALVVWNRPDGTSSTCCDRVQARARSAAAGVFGPIELLSQPGYSSSYPDAALDAAGNAVVAWWRAGPLPDLVQARARSAAGTLAQIQRLRDVSATGDAFPRVAVDGGGDALVVWQRLYKDATWVETRSRSATGALGDVTRRRGRRARVAIDVNGNGVVVWEYLNRVRAMTRSVSGASGPIQVLSNPVGSAPEVAVDPLGHALAVWVHYDGTNLRIQAAPGP